MKLQELLDKEIDSIGDNHIGSNNEETPLKEGAFNVSDSKKISLIQEKVYEILDILGMDLTDDSLRGTPRRVAKMFVNEIFSGINPKNRPEMSTFENKYNYGEMLVEKNITLYSTCEHHLLPIVGLAHVAYISNGNVVGLSKINRIVKYYAERPQVQEKLTVQIIDFLKKELETDDVACVVEAKHLCVSMRGIKDVLSLTTTAEYSGKFLENNIKQEMLQLIGANNE